MSMRNTLLAYIDRFRHDRRQRVMLGSVLLVLAVIVTLLVYWQLRLSGIAMTNETYCGYEEHVHTDECYEYTLICELEEIGHVHDESCYEEQQVLVCGLEETEGHTHSESCYDEEGNLVCGLEEFEGHTHSEACYETQTVLICGQEETPDAHVHTDECYEKTLICELEEHTHTVECLIDLTADVEDETIWSATIPELTGDLRTDIVAIAESQVGYTESTANYSLGEDGITHYGYTRYGAWYGSEYADWDSIFAAFCLDYAGIADEFSYNAGSFAWTVDLANLGYYQSADSYVPSAGDLVFIDTDLDGRADKTAVVVSVDNVFSTVTAIQGNYTVTDVDGSSTDTVAYVTYSMTATAAPVLATISEDGETVDNVAPVILGYANVTYAVETTDEETAEDEVTDEEEIDLEGETDEEITDEEITDEIAEPEVVGSAAVLTYAGEDYTITVTYGEDALIPEGTYLVAYEYSSGSETYLQRYAESAAIYGWEGEPTEDFRVFNIGLYYDGVEIEPAAEIQVSITYTAAENSDSVSVTHHDETAEPLYAVSEYSEETGTETVTFTTDGFSDYSFMLMSTGNEEGNNVTGTANNSNTSSLYTDLGDTELSGSAVSWSYSSVSYADGSFTLDLNAYFTLYGIDLADSLIYYIYLPEDVTVSDDIIGQQYTGREDGTNSEVFYYYFEIDSNGNYYIKIEFFDQDYIDASKDKTAQLHGNVDYSRYQIDSEDATIDSSKLKVTFEDGTSIDIPISEIKTDGTETWSQDISVEKTSSSYDPDSNSITYTVTITSTNGTSEITLKDVLDLMNNLDYADDLTITDISVKNVEYQQNVVYSNNWGGWTSWEYESTLTEGNGYTYSVDTSEGKLTIILKALSGADDNGTTAGDRYIITYTVTFSEEVSMSTTVTNKATASSTDESGTIEHYDTETRTIESSTVEKSGTYDSDTGTITWTITYTAAGQTSYTLKDDAFANATDLTISPNSGYTISGDTITFTNDTTSPIEYTITYTTKYVMDFGSSSDKVTNTVYVYDGTDEVDEDTEEVPVSGGGGLEKEVTGTKDGTSDDTLIIEWKTTISVPSTGIAADTTFYDYLSASWDWKDTGNSDTTKQWFTYDQLMTLLNSLSTSITVDGTTNTTISRIALDSTENYTIYATTDSITWSSTYQDWISYDDLVSGGIATYGDYKFTAFKIVFNKAVSVSASGDIVLSYSTTANTSDIDISRQFVNWIEMGSLSAKARYIGYEPVYKTDGDGNKGETYPTSTDGAVTWKVYVRVDSTTTGDFVVTDTLPSEVSLTSVLVETTNGSVKLSPESTLSEQNTKTDLTSGTLNGATIGGTAEVTYVSGEKGTTTVVVNIPEDAYSTTGDGYYIVLTYTCQIDGWDNEESDLSSANPTITHTLPNSVSVERNGSEYGEDDQTQIVDHEWVDESATGTYDAVEKEISDNGMGDDNYVEYTVALNLDGNKRNGGSDMTFTDTLTTTDPLTATLAYGTVKFYQLYPITETDDGNGTYTYTYTIGGHTYTLYTGDSTIDNWYSSNSSIYCNTSSGSPAYFYKVALSINWNYEVTEDANNKGTYYHSLTAEIPDNTRILVVYSYHYDYTGSTYGVWDDGKYYDEGAYVSAKNTATLTGSTSTTIDDETKEITTYIEETTKGTITNAGGLAVYKSGRFTSDFIEGTVFELYVYDSTTGEFKSTGQTYTTNSIGYFYVDPIKDTNGTTFADKYYDWYIPNTLYYLVEIKASTNYLADYETKYYFYWSVDVASAATGYYPTDTPTSFVYSNLSSTVQAAVVENDIESVTETSASTFNIKNTPITSFTLKKTNKSNGNTIAGATFALYRFAGHNSSTGDEVWIRIGTYVTDSNGEIIITYDPDLYSYDTAYKIVEVTPADGYNIGYGDVTEFYFWWSTENGSVTGLSNWGTDPDGSTTGYEVGREYETAINISEKSEEVTATNTKTTTAISATKIWLDSNGDLITDTSGLSATVQLYYYLYDPDTKTYARGDDAEIKKDETKLVTLTTSSGTTTTTTAALSSSYSTFTISGTGYNTAFYEGGTTANNFLDALFNDDYSDRYIEVEIKNINSVSNLSIILQAKNATAYGGSSYYEVIARIDGGTVVSTDSQTDTTTVRYSISDILAQLESSTILNNYITQNNCDLETAVKALFNGVFFQTSASNEQATATLFKVVGSASSAKSESKTVSNYNTWLAWLQGEDNAKLVLTDGAVLRFTYTCSNYSANTTVQLNVGIQYGASSSSTTTSVTIPASSGTIDVPVSSILNGLTLTTSDYIQAFTQPNSWGGSSVTAFEGTITNVEVLIPASSTTTSQTYTIDATDSTVQTEVAWDWLRYFDNGNADAQSALSQSGAVVRITYTDTTGGSIEFGIQTTDSLYATTSDYTTTSVNSGDEATLIIPVSELTYDSGFSWDNYNVIYINAGYAITVNSVEILVPYDVTSSLAGVVVDTTVDGVVLYNPTFDAISISGNDWNVLVSTSTEAASGKGYDYTKVNSTYGDYLCGYAFFNAIYSNIDSELVITLSNVSADSSDIQSLLKDYLEFVVQGDTSVDYSAIASNIKPTKVVDKGNNTYEVYYSSSDIVSSLSSANGIYDTAAKALADYFALCLKLNGSTTFSADVTGLKVVGTLETSDTYTSNVLTGYAYGIAYSDDNASSYTYELNASNGWTISLANLPLTMTKTVTINGVDVELEFDRYYYFVETSNNTAYTTTYSQVEGENGGGEIVIVNSEIAKTSVSVEKKWTDGTNDLTTSSNITDEGHVNVSLYYYLKDDNGNIYYDGTTADTNTMTGDVTSNLESLVGKGSSVTSFYVDECEIKYDSTSQSWTWSVDNLPLYEAIGTTKYTCYYYFVETSTNVKGLVDITYSDANVAGIRSGSVTITNKVSEDAKGYALPSTGGQNERIYIFIGLALMVLALLGCAYRNIHRIRFSAVSNDTPVRKPSKPGAPSEEKCLRHQKKLSKDRNGDSRAGPKS